MCQFIESIKLMDGKLFRLELHQQRMNLIFDSFYPFEPKIDLSQLLHSENFPLEGFYKCRIVFDTKHRSIEFLPYKIPEINTLKIVEIDLPAVFYKSADREKINEAYKLRANCDDILMIRNNLITDSSYCNIAVFDGEKWLSPKTPLIYGVQRMELLRKQKISEKDIRIDSIYSYQSICLFNAMIEFGEIVFNTTNIGSTRICVG